jgi:hypothetical protein
MSDKNALAYSFKDGGGAPPQKKPSLPTNIRLGFVSVHVRLKDQGLNKRILNINSIFPWLI